ncbi:MAG TPA: YfiR family protein [Usitatibacter sp.]|nr:YfiR family protein [Usitatibacter sp.]
MNCTPVRWLAALLLATASSFAQAQAAEAVSESSVKAAFLYKFAGYVEWPRTDFHGPEAPFVIGVMRDDAVAAELQKLVPGRSVNGHPVVVRRMKPGEALRDLHILLIGGDDPDRAAIRSAQQQGVLVVTESPLGLAAGGAINFMVVDERVGFEVSVEAAQRSGHRISSRLLAVARRVVQRGE